MQNIGTRTIRSERLVLRRFEPGDCAAAHRNWASDEAVQKMYSEPVYATMREVEELLGKYIASYERDDCYRWAVTLDGECIGQIAFWQVDTANHCAEIEYCIGAAFQKRGFATEATRAVMAFGFEQMGLHNIRICHKDINPASRRVIEKCGFTYEGTLRDYFYMDGRYVGRLYYSMLETEWNERSR